MDRARRGAPGHGGFHLQVVCAAVWAALRLPYSSFPAQAQQQPQVVHFDAPWPNDYEKVMVQRTIDGIDAFVDRGRDGLVAEREKHRTRDPPAGLARARSIEPNRERFRRIVGPADQRVRARVERFGRGEDSPVVAETEEVAVYQVR